MYSGGLYWLLQEKKHLFIHNLRRDQPRVHTELSDEELQALYTVQDEHISPHVHAISRLQLTILWPLTRATVRSGV